MDRVSTAAATAATAATAAAAAVAGGVVAIDCVFIGGRDLEKPGKGWQSPFKSGDGKRLSAYVSFCLLLSAAVAAAAVRLSNAAVMLLLLSCCCCCCSSSSSRCMLLRRCYSPTEFCCSSNSRIRDSSSMRYVAYSFVFCVCCSVRP